VELVTQGDAWSGHVEKQVNCLKMAGSWGWNMSEK